MKTREYVYRQVRRQLGDYISRFGPKQGTKYWHLIMEERVVTSVPDGMDVGVYAEELRPYSVFVSGPTVARGRTSFKPFFMDSFDAAVKASNLYSNSAVYSVHLWD